MSQFFESLKAIQAKRDAPGREDARGATRVVDFPPVSRSRPSRGWLASVVGGALTFVAGVFITVLMTTLVRSSPVQHRPVRVAPVAAAPDALPSRAVPGAEPGEPPAIAMVAVVTDAAEPPGASDSPVADDPTITSHPMAAATLPEPLRNGDFWVQVGAFNEHDNAIRFQGRLAQQLQNAAVRPGRPGAPSWVVAVGPYLNEQAAAEAKMALARDGLSGFVVGGTR
jgi:cell division protein FtsN